MKHYLKKCKIICILILECFIFAIYKQLKYKITMISSDLLKGSLKTIVLKVLEENGRMYGYEITKKVEDLTSGKIRLTYGALYPVLHKLEDEGVLFTESENFNNRIRIYYKLTPKGRSVVKEKLDEMNEFIETLRRIVEPLPGLKNV